MEAPLISRTLIGLRDSRILTGISFTRAERPLQKRSTESAFHPKIGTCLDKGNPAIVD